MKFTHKRIHIIGSTGSGKTRVGRSFEEADIIIFLSPRPMNRAIRIITRFIKQRTKLERSKYQQTLKRLIEMLKWNSQFDTDNKKKIHEMLEQHKEKLIVVKSNKEMILRVAYECDIR